MSRSGRSNGREKHGAGSDEATSLEKSHAPPQTSTQARVTDVPLSSTRSPFSASQAIQKDTSSGGVGAAAEEFADPSYSTRVDQSIGAAGASPAAPYIRLKSHTDETSKSTPLRVERRRVKGPAANNTSSKPRQSQSEVDRGNEEAQVQVSSNLRAEQTPRTAPTILKDQGEGGLGQSPAAATAASTPVDAPGSLPSSVGPSIASDTRVQNEPCAQQSSASTPHDDENALSTAPPTTITKTTFTTHGVGGRSSASLAHYDPSLRVDGEQHVTAGPATVSSLLNMQQPPLQSHAQAPASPSAVEQISQNEQPEPQKKASKTTATQKTTPTSPPPRRSRRSSLHHRSSGGDDRRDRDHPLRSLTPSSSLPNVSTVAAEATADTFAGATAFGLPSSTSTDSNLSIGSSSYQYAFLAEPPPERASIRARRRSSTSQPTRPAAAAANLRARSSRSPPAAAHSSSASSIPRRRPSGPPAAASSSSTSLGANRTRTASGSSSSAKRGREGEDDGAAAAQVASTSTASQLSSSPSSKRRASGRRQVSRTRRDDDDDDDKDDQQRQGIPSPPMEELRGRRYELIILQQPSRGCAFGSNLLSRLPCAPPMIVQLKVTDENEQELSSDAEEPFLVCHASLLTIEGHPADLLSPIPTPTRPQPQGESSGTTSAQIGESDSGATTGAAGSTSGPLRRSSRRASRSTTEAAGGTATAGAGRTLSSASPTTAATTSGARSSTTARQRQASTASVTGGPAAASSSIGTATAPPSSVMNVPSTPVRMLYGSLAATPQKFHAPPESLTGSIGGSSGGGSGGSVIKTYFLFPEICVRAKGIYSIKLSLMKLPRLAPPSNTTTGTGTSAITSAALSESDLLATAQTSTFEVCLSHEYTSPYVTDLTRFFARQGAALPLPSGDRFAD